MEGKNRGAMKEIIYWTPILIVDNLIELLLAMWSGMKQSVTITATDQLSNDIMTCES